MFSQNKNRYKNKRSIQRTRCQYVVIGSILCVAFLLYWRQTSVRNHDNDVSYREIGKPFVFLNKNAGRDFVQSELRNSHNAVAGNGSVKEELDKTRIPIIPRPLNKSRTESKQNLEKLFNITTSNTDFTNKTISSSKVIPSNLAASDTINQTSDNGFTVGEKQTDNRRVSHTGIDRVTRTGIGRVSHTGIGRVSHTGIGLVTRTGIDLVTRRGIDLVTSTGIDQKNLDVISDILLAYPEMVFIDIGGKEQHVTRQKEQKLENTFIAIGNLNLQKESRKNGTYHNGTLKRETDSGIHENIHRDLHYASNIGSKKTGTKLQPKNSRYYTVKTINVDDAVDEFQLENKTVFIATHNVRSAYGLLESISLFRRVHVCYVLMEFDKDNTNADNVTKVLAELNMYPLQLRKSLTDRTSTSFTPDVIFATNSTACT